MKLHLSAQFFMQQNYNTWCVCYRHLFSVLRTNSVSSFRQKQCT